MPGLLGEGRAGINLVPIVTQSASTNTDRPVRRNPRKAGRSRDRGDVSSSGPPAARINSARPASDLFQPQDICGLIATGDVQGKRAPEEFAVGIESDSRVIVFLGQMTEAGPLEAIGRGLDESRCLKIREVSSRSANPLFEVRRIGSLLQHLFVVIALDDDRIER